MAKPILMVLFLVIFFLANPFEISCNIIRCPKIEKEALLSFKQSLKDPYNRLSSWNTHDTSNCCNWKGVVCSNITGNIHQLHLHGEGFSNSSLQGKINHSLLKLKHLKYLDLSENYFNETIPSFIGSLTSLEYLNLSGAGFYGKIPPTLGNLSRLHTLSLEPNWGRWPDRMYADSFEWLRGLSQLEHLNMNSVNLTNTGNWIEVINTLPSLLELHLVNCSLNLSFDPSSDVNVTSLAILDLHSNYGFSFSHTIAKWIFRHINLVYLDLSGHELEGPIPAVSNITKLQFIYLGWNYLNSTNFPDWLYSCKDLEFVSLENHSLQGRISKAIGNLTSLTTFNLRGNKLSGDLPREFVNLFKLQNLDLSENMLQGKIPDMFGNMSNLGDLKLSFNKFTGNLPMSIGRLTNLVFLEVGSNMMRGFVTETHFTNLTQLMYFYAPMNQLTLKLSPD